jgi:hypothetical protein
MNSSKRMTNAERADSPVTFSNPRWAPERIQLRASVNFAREQAHRKLAVRGFRADRIGVVMQSPNEPAYNRPGNYILDDWR